MLEAMVVRCGEQEIAEQKLWRAVIANTIEEWIHGPLRLQREAEEFLFHDDDFRLVCFSAGMNPEYVRERLKRFEHPTAHEPDARVAKLVLGLLGAASS